jgi:hypothetical protein
MQLEDKNLYDQLINYFQDEPVMHLSEHLSAQIPAVKVTFW